MTFDELRQLNEAREEIKRLREENERLRRPRTMLDPDTGVGHVTEIDEGVYLIRKGEDQ